MELTDKVRDEDMVDAGVCVVDAGNTSTWRLDDPTILQRERDERRLKLKEEKLRILRQKRLQKVLFLTPLSFSGTLQRWKIASFQTVLSGLSWVLLFYAALIVLPKYHTRH